MKEMLELLEEAIMKQVDLKGRNEELNVLGIISDEELERLNSIHNYAVNRINEIHIEVFNRINKED